MITYRFEAIKLLEARNPEELFKKTSAAYVDRNACKDAFGTGRSIRSERG